MLIENTEKEIKIGINEKYIDIFRISLIVSCTFWGTALVYNFLFMIMFILFGKI